MPPHHSSPLSSEHYLPRRDGTATASLPHTPYHNHLLAALPPKDYERLAPHLVSVHLPLGCTVHDAGDQEKYLYFLTSGIVSRFCVTLDGASAEFAVTGNEGVIGVAAFLGGKRTPSHALALSVGHAYRLAADIVKNEFARGGALPRLLLRYTQALIVQTGQVAVCNRLHPLEQRMCRWILSCMDRLPSNELTITQELLAHMLGVRREGVTAAAQNLQKAGRIQYSRGRITLLDRAGLEADVCECYAVIKREYDRLLPHAVNPKSRSSDLRPWFGGAHTDALPSDILPKR